MSQPPMSAEVRLRGRRVGWLDYYDEDVTCRLVFDPSWLESSDREVLGQQFEDRLPLPVESAGLYAYPDLTVICGQPKISPKDGITLTNPTVIFEVLSASTEAYDRGAKFAHYRRLSTLSAYVLVSQDQERVEVFERAEDYWRLHEATEGAV